MNFANVRSVCILNRDVFNWYIGSSFYPIYIYVNIPIMDDFFLLSISMHLILNRQLFSECPAPLLSVPCSPSQRALLPFSACHAPLLSVPCSPSQRALLPFSECPAPLLSVPCSPFYTKWSCCLYIETKHNYDRRDQLLLTLHKQTCETWPVAAYSA